MVLCSCTDTKKVVDNEELESPIIVSNVSDSTHSVLLDLEGINYLEFPDSSEVEYDLRGVDKAQANNFLAELSLLITDPSKMSEHTFSRDRFVEMASDVIPPQYSKKTDRQWALNNSQVNNFLALMNGCKDFKITKLMINGYKLGVNKYDLDADFSYVCDSEAKHEKEGMVRGFEIDKKVFFVLITDMDLFYTNLMSEE